LETTTEVFLSAGDLTSSAAGLLNFSQSFTRQQVGNLTQLPGDFNDDRVVDAEDLLTWNESFDSDDGGDANGDFVTDGSDFLYWQRYVGSVIPPAATIVSIPEPAAIWSAAAALGVLVCRRACITRIRVSRVRSS
jgi:hypothetical protein